MTPPDLVPGELWTREWTPTQEEFDRFAALSGDDNPIHVDPEFSARTRFGRTVSHGMLIYSQLWAMVTTALPGQHHVGQDLMFPNPAFAGEALLLAVHRLKVPGMVNIVATRVADGEAVLLGKCTFGAAP